MNCISTYNNVAQNKGNFHEQNTSPQTPEESIAILYKVDFAYRCGKCNDSIETSWFQFEKTCNKEDIVSNILNFKILGTVLGIVYLRKMCIQRRRCNICMVNIALRKIE